MTDFGFVADMKVTNDAVREYTMYGITLPNGESPTLIGRHGGETNKPYFNELLKTAADKAKMIQAGKVNTGMLAENREQDRALYPQFVLTGWKDVCDAEGEIVAFTKQGCVDFLGALPDHVFDDVRNFFGNPANFMGTVSADDAVAQGKS